MTAPPDGAVPVVELDGVVRRYPAVTAVDGVSLRVGPGEVVGVLGPSGCGKSTLLRMLAGTERPDRGAVRYGGSPAWPGRARHVVYPRPGFVSAVFQDPFTSLDPRWAIWRSLTEPLTVGDRPGRAARREVASRWLARVGLDGVPLDARPLQLSGGQCQRVAVVRAVIAGPSLLLADEPTARQDVVTAAGLAVLLREVLPPDAGAVVVSHDRAWVERVATRLLRMDAGRLTGEEFVAGPSSTGG